MDSEKPVDELIVTRRSWKHYDYLITKAEGTKAACVLMDKWGDSGTILIAQPFSHLVVSYGLESILEVSPPLLAGGLVPESTSDMNLRVVGRCWTPRSNYLVESVSRQYILRTAGDGLRRGDREIRLVPEGIELEALKGEVGELVGKIRFDSVGKRLYSATIQREVPDIVKMFCIYLALLRGRIDDTVVRALQK